MRVIAHHVTDVTGVCVIGEVRMVRSEEEMENGSQQ